METLFDIRTLLLCRHIVGGHEHKHDDGDGAFCAQILRWIAQQTVKVVYSARFFGRSIQRCSIPSVHALVPVTMMCGMNRRWQVVGSGSGRRGYFRLKTGFCFKIYGVTGSAVSRCPSVAWAQSIAVF